MNRITRSSYSCVLLLAALVLSDSCLAQTVVATVPTTGFSPGALAINTVTNKIYILNLSSGTVDVLDGSTNSIVATVAVSSNSARLALNENTNKIYVLDQFAGSVSVIDGATNTLTGSVNFGVRIGTLAINPVTNRIYVTTNRSAVNVITGPTNGTVSVVDGATNSILADVPIAPFPTALAVNPVTNKIYVGGQQNSLSPAIVVIDGSTNSIVGSAFDPLNSLSVMTLGINKTLNTIYATNGADIMVLNGNSNPLIPQTVRLFPMTGALAVNEATNETYFGVSPASVAFLDQPNSFNPLIVNSLLVGDDPLDVAINQATNRIYVPAGQGNVLTVIDGRDHSIVTSLPTGSFPAAVAVNPVTNRILAEYEDTVERKIAGGKGGLEPNVTYFKSWESLRNENQAPQGTITRLAHGGSRFAGGTVGNV